MSKEQPPIIHSFASEVVNINIEEEMKQSYLDYAMSVIVGRALPDVRDGLKPVHRRVLFSMYEVSNDWNKPYKKSARIVGDVMGKYHPHGDLAIYDTIVRMAQPFSLRYMLVDGQGNFGSVDGDRAAAKRGKVGEGLHRLARAPGVERDRGQRGKDADAELDLALGPVDGDEAARDREDQPDGQCAGEGAVVGQAFQQDTDHRHDGADDGRCRRSRPARPNRQRHGVARHDVGRRHDAGTGDWRTAHRMGRRPGDLSDQRTAGDSGVAHHGSNLAKRRAVQSILSRVHRLPRHRPARGCA